MRILFLVFMSIQPLLGIASYLEDLEEFGYCIIPQVVSTAEAEVLYERIWHEFIERAWPNCRLDDRSNWEEEFPMYNKVGVFAGSAGQIQVMWDLRQDPRIVEIFSQIWNTDDLAVSMDGLSFMCPPEIREGYIDPWPHVDQSEDVPASESSLKTNPYTIQGQFLLEDSFDGDGGFYCIPGSHLRFSEFASKLNAIMTMGISKEEKKRLRNEFLQELFGTPYPMQHITAPKGSLILWDSRTIHWNQHASKDRPYSDSPKVRMVGYLCYVPKDRLTEEAKALRKEAFEMGASTGHDPAYSVPNYTENCVQQEFKRYLQDPSYVQPEIALTSLGEFLLGLSD